MNFFQLNCHEMIAFGNYRNCLEKYNDDKINCMMKLNCCNNLRVHQQFGVCLENKSRLAVYVAAE